MTKYLFQYFVQDIRSHNMNIAQAAKETATVAPVTTTIYINLAFAQLADDMNSGVLAHQFNGKGRKISSLTEAQELTYLFYSSDAAGEQKITPPFNINNGDNIQFTLQAAPGDGSKATFKWKGIIQSHNDLHLVSKTKSTYNANIDGQANRSDTDEVTITTNFKVNGDKFAVIWDPKVKIGRR